MGTSQPGSGELITVLNLSKLWMATFTVQRGVQSWVSRSKSSPRTV